MSKPVESWSLTGEYFESCNCTVLCPCLLSHAQAEPTDKHCDVVLAVHISKGKFGGIDLSGLNAVQVLQTPGPMAQGNGTLAVYVDQKGFPSQREALERIFTGAAGGPPAAMGGMVSTRLPVKSVPIEFTLEGSLRRLVIPNIADVTVEGIDGLPQKVVWFENVMHPFSNRLAAGRGRESHYHDHSLAFDNSGRNGHFSPISWTSG
jgi:hypothetical protein